MNLHQFNKEGLRQIKLNGWQRLWVVISIIHLLIVTFLGIAFFSLPTQSKLEYEWVHELINTVKGPNQYAYQIRDTYKDISDAELIVKITEQYGPNSATPTGQLEVKPTSQTVKFLDLKVAGINKKYESQKKELLRNQVAYLLNYILACLLWFLIPIGLLYALGLSVGWIVKGFKNSN